MLMRRNKFLFILALVLGLGLISGCGNTSETTVSEDTSEFSSGEVVEVTDVVDESEELIAESEVEELEGSGDFEALVNEARGSTVTFYGWGGDELRNKWLNEKVAPLIKEKYDINLDVVGMDINDILAKLSGEKQAGQGEGTIDMIWINGENFFSAKENGLLYGPFAEDLPGFEKYLDEDDEEVQNDFGFPIEGYEAPYGKAQMVLINDSAVSPETPKNTEELLEYAKKYEGQVTYPASSDFTGSAFIRTIIYDIVGHEQFMDMEADREVVKEAIEPALEYLRQLNPYLWNQGKTFPATSGEVENMFQDGELVLNMSYGSYHAAILIDNGSYPESVQTFLFDNGTVGNTSYMGIAFNSPNKAGAQVVINEIMSAELQASQFEELRTLPVVDYDKLSDEEKARFDKVDIGQGVLAQDVLLSKRLPEMPADIVPIVEEIWLEEVVGK